VSALPEGFPRSKADTAGRVWKCRKDDEACTRTKPCPSCRGARNRRKGKRGQGFNRRALEDLCDVKASWAGKLANEETADHLPVRYENKAGKAGGANTIARHYLAAEAQSEAARAIGDTRPFIASFSPDGMSDGLIVVRTSVLPAFVQAVVESANRP
jgi:hypothetical protein